MEQLIHIGDPTGYYNGGSGRWTVCGVEWTRQPKGEPNCPDCIQLEAQEGLVAAWKEWH